MVGDAVKGRFMKGPALLLICASACLAQQRRTSFTGTITGTLTGDDRTSIVGGYVSLHLLPPHPPGRRRQTEWNALSGAGGYFRFDGLPEGRYRLCAQVPRSTWLNPCEWGLQAPVAALSGLQPFVSLSMVLKKGAVVPIRLEDTGRLLFQHEGRTPGAHLLLGLGSDAGTFRIASLASEDGTGRNHQIVVPFNSPVKLVVFSSFFRLADAAGLPLPRTAVTIPITVPAGQQPAAIRIRVTGGGPP